MNDDEKKPVVGEAQADELDKKPEQDDETKVEVTLGDSVDKKTDSKDGDDRDLTKSDLEDGDKADSIDITAALSGDDAKDDESKSDDEPEEEVSEEERELGRIEGIESAETSKPSVEEPTMKPEVDDTVDDADAVMAPVDLEKEAAEPADDAKNPLVEALRKQEQSKDVPKKGKAGLLAGLLGVLLVVSLAGAGYFYMQVADTNTQLAAAQAELASTQSKNTSLTVDLQKAKAGAEQQSAAATTQYKVIEELGVRYKVTDANKSLVYGYVGSKDAKISGVEFTTVELANIAEPKNGVDGYPCALGGTTQGTITRYTDGTTVLMGSTASKVGKKIGDAYYVYTTAQAVCSTQKSDEQTKAKAAIKQVYDSLEAIPVATATNVSADVSSSTTKQ